MHSCLFKFPWVIWLLWGRLNWCFKSYVLKLKSCSTGWASQSVYKGKKLPAYQRYPRADTRHTPRFIRVPRRARDPHSHMWTVDWIVRRNNTNVILARVHWFDSLIYLRRAGLILCCTTIQSNFKITFYEKKVNLSFPCPVFTFYVAYKPIGAFLSTTNSIRIWRPINMKRNKNFMRILMIEPTPWEAFHVTVTQLKLVLHSVRGNLYSGSGPELTLKLAF